MAFKLPKAPSAFTSWLLRVALGSAKITQTRVSFGPIPMRLKAPFTFTLAGKFWTASRALPSKTTFGSVKLLISILLDQ